ncbi:MAG: hypothetical protein QOH72_5599 [Solirubrobacteraceae bacterium]|nr:hypothetical protein [Solirubrobacteraceae bacterium]
MKHMSDEAPEHPEKATESEIRALLARLGRPHPSGGTVIERAALMAEGADFDATIAWILAHGGQPEEAVTAAPSGGLHGLRTDRVSRSAGSSRPRRFVLPADALTG